MTTETNSTSENDRLAQALARIEAAAKRIDDAAREMSARAPRQDAVLKQEVGAALVQLDLLIAEIDN